MTGLGVGRGDTIGVYMPMVPEAVIAMYAIAKIGAIYMPIFSGFGAPAISTRLDDASAKVLITSDGFYRRGDKVQMKSVADEAVAESPSVEHVVVFRRFPDDERDVRTEGHVVGRPRVRKIDRAPRTRARSGNAVHDRLHIGDDR